MNDSQKRNFKLHNVEICYIVKNIYLLITRKTLSFNETLLHFFQFYLSPT